MAEVDGVISFVKYAFDCAEPIIETMMVQTMNMHTYQISAKEVRQGGKEI
ncbi:MAG: hypothetical protein IJ209_04865 [Bacteroidaceae bacterium]|nr:hypothetical protein [Bacteroidaceae bacterium]